MRRHVRSLTLSTVIIIIIIIIIIMLCIICIGIRTHDRHAIELLEAGQAPDDVVSVVM